MVKPRGLGERVLLVVLAAVAMWCGSLPASWTRLVLLALLATGCASARPATVIPPPAVRALPPTVQLARILEITTSSGDKCHGTPIGIVQLLTAAHCSGSGEIQFVGQREIKGVARLMWRDDTRDLAMFQASVAPGWEIVAIAALAPEPMTDLFWRAYIPETRSVAIRGEYIGLDRDDDLTVVGFVTPGASGSGLLNAAGELVGVVKAAYNTLTLSRGLRISDFPMDAGTAMRHLIDAVKFSPAGVATPIREWPRAR